MKGKMVTHGTKLTPEDLVTLQFFQEGHQFDEYWTQQEVSDKHEIGRIDILARKGSDYIVIEVKPNADTIDEAIGQVLRYGYLLSKQPAYKHANLQKWIVAPNCYPSHTQLCAQLGITLILLGPSKSRHAGHS